MSARSQQSELERIIEALIFSFFTYVCYALAFGTALPIEWTSIVGKDGAQHFVVSAVYRWKLIFIVLTSTALGLGWGYVKDNDLLARTLRQWKITRRSSRDSVWNDVFISLGGTVQVGLADGRMAIGWLARYADTDNERTLFLEQASWVSETGDIVAIPGSGLLLTEKSEIKFVMFLDDDATR
jgi:hypothetical protein